MEYLQYANELLTLTTFEEWKLLFFKLLILSIAFVAFLLVGKDVLSHLNFVKNLIPSHEEKLHIIEEFSH